ncbi:uncharacterized protein LOC136087811 isoform X2 [Hydra vulgaris]|uniref:Uncharacterized protein LOC136087811 isoform X2 n=1 Tax=Hydra vulgaris TaxID=6087 RepID=A0ABM4CZN9_HYDVU
MMGKRFWNLFKISAAIRKAVTTLQAPTSDWKIYPARILYTTDFYEKAQSRLEKTADTLNIETDTEEKKGTKQKRKTAMTFSESDKDIVVGDEELYRRYYFDSSNSQRTSNVILNIADFQNVALSWMAKIDKKMSSLSRCGGNTPYKSAFAFGKLLMSEDAGACFNVSGGSLKINFKTYTLYHMIVDAITRQHHDAKICEC